MRKKKLLLINPTSNYRKGFVRSEFSRYQPLAYGIISTLTPDNWEVEIVDENFEKFEYRDADLVGLTGYTSTICRAYEIADIYLKKNISVVIGGIHASMRPKEAIKYANSVVVGEAESCWNDVITDFENDSLKQFYHGERLSLKDTPKIDYSLFNSQYLFGSTYTTRGCPFNCEFCTVTAFNGGKYRMRTVDDVLDEIENIKQEKFFFIDDNIIGYSKSSKEHARQIFQGMIDRGIKKHWWSQASLNFADEEDLIKLAYKSGCRTIFIGIEAETVEGLKSTNKQLNAKYGVDKYNSAFRKIRKHGIAVLGSFIFGIDSDSEQDLINRKEFILSAEVDCYQSGILTPLPGTRTFDRLEKENRLTKTNFPKDWEYYSVVDVTWKPSKIEPERLTEVMYEIWKEIYGKKALMKKFISTLRTTKDIVSSTWALTTNITYRNAFLELFEEGKEKFDIETLIGPFDKMFDKNK